MQARPNGPAETSLPERPGPLGWLSHSRSTRQVIGWTAWLALGSQELEEGRREEPRRCVRCARWEAPPTMVGSAHPCAAGRPYWAGRYVRDGRETCRPRCRAGAKSAATD